MSKAALRKELQTFTSEQLVDLILQAYQSRKEFKEYFEYFLDPNPDKVFDKYAALAGKELARSSRGRSKIRVTWLKKLMADFKSFVPGDELVLGLYFYIIDSMVMYSNYGSFLNDTQLNGIGRFVAETLDYADSAQCADLWERNFAILNQRINPGSQADLIIREALKQHQAKRLKKPLK